MNEKSIQINLVGYSVSQLLPRAVYRMAQAPWVIGWGTGIVSIIPCKNKSFLLISLNVDRPSNVGLIMLTQMLEKYYLKSVPFNPARSYCEDVSEIKMLFNATRSITAGEIMWNNSWWIGKQSNSRIQTVERCTLRQISSLFFVVITQRHSEL